MIHCTYLQVPLYIEPFVGTAVDAYIVRPDVISAAPMPIRLRERIIYFMQAS
jgi:hypothetical protein